MSTGALSFGTINPLKATDTLTSAAIVVSCDVSPPPTVTLSVGPGTSGSRRPRYLVRGAGGERIAYELYLDPGMQRPLGDGLEGTSTVSERVFKDKPWVISVYGLVPARQNVSVGPYFDTIQVRVDF